MRIKKNNPTNTGNLGVATALFAALACATATATPVFAQSGLTEGKSEAGATIAVTGGAFSVGGTFGKAITERIFAYGNLGFIPGDSATYSGVKASSH